MITKKNQHIFKRSRKVLTPSLRILVCRGMACCMRLVCMYVGVFKARITAMVLRARPQDWVCQCLCVGYKSYSRPLDSRVDGSCVLIHVKLPRCGEAPRKSRALSWALTQAIGALVHGFTHWATRAPMSFFWNSSRWVSIRNSISKCTVRRSWLQ